MNNTQTAIKSRYAQKKRKFVQSYDSLEFDLDSYLDIKLMSLLIDYDSFHQTDKRNV